MAYGWPGETSVDSSGDGRACHGLRPSHWSADASALHNSSFARFRDLFTVVKKGFKSRALDDESFVPPITILHLK